MRPYTKAKADTGRRRPRFFAPRLLPACFLTMALLAGATARSPAVTASALAEIAVSPPQFWVREVGRDAFPVLLGDVNGDGRADTLRVIPASGARRTLVTVLRTSALGKPRFPARATTGFGPRPLAFACGAFANRKGLAEVAAVMTNGAVQVAHGYEEPAESQSPDAAPPSVRQPSPRKQRRRAAAGKTAESVQAVADTGDDGLGGDPDEESRSEAEDALDGRELFTKTTRAAMIPAPLRPTLPVRALLPGDFDGDDRSDLLLLDANGKLLFLQNETPLDSSGKTEAAPRFTARAVAGTLADVRRIACGFLGGAGVPVGDRRTRLVYVDSGGRLLRAVLRFDKPAADPELSPGVSLLRDGDTVPTSEPLAVGHFVGTPNACDILLGKRLLVGGDKDKTLVLTTLPSTSDARLYKETAGGIVGDVDGNGRDDLLCIRRIESGVRLRERTVGDDGMVCFFHDPRRTDDPVWSFVSTANDGIPDAWKTGKVRPNGYNLAAMGCRVGRQSLIIEVQRVADVPEERVRAMMAAATAYYASLPTTNPDGSHGISLHTIFRETIPEAESAPTSRRNPPAIRAAARVALMRKYHTARAQGIVHWMRIKGEPGGVAIVMGSNGSSSASLPVFLHELGHQVGLGHHGGWSAEFSVLYASIMSYHYHPQNSGGTPHYSTGRMKNVVLRETALTEHLPIPPATVTYLTAKPYRFAVRPAPDGASVWVDWNRNGRFDTNPVRADINLDKKISDEPQGDFDDIAVITGYGLSRSLSYVSQ